MDIARERSRRRRGLGLAAVAWVTAAACASVPPRGDVQEASGRLTSLRVRDVGAQDDLPGGRDALEVLFQLDSEPDKLFGFHLGPGRQRAARQGMLDLLRDALGDDAPVTIGYTIEPGRQEGVVVRTMLTRQPETPDTVRVVELPQFPRTADDPIVRGLRLDPRVILAQYPDPPPDLADEGAHDLFEETTWTYVDETELGPGQTREETVSFAEPVVVQARANWFGSPGPVEMAATKDGTPLGEGKVHLSPPDRGTVLLEVKVDAPGSATVSVVNRGSSPVSVEMVIGVLPQSLLPP